MSQPTTDETALLTVAEAVLEDYFADLPISLSADASKELQRLYAYIAKRKNPAPPRTRKPKVVNPPTEHTAANNTVIPVPDGLRHTESAITKRGKR